MKKRVMKKGLKLSPNWGGRWKFCLLIFIVLVSLGFVFATSSSTVEFANPTPFDKAVQSANSVYINQYFNKLNAEAHYNSTGPEIWEQTKGEITHLVAARNNISYFDLDSSMSHDIDPVIGGVEYKGKGKWVLPDLPGIGAEFDPEFLKNSDKIEVF